MKKFIVPLALISLLAASCSEDEQLAVSENSPAAVSFYGGVTTRVSNCEWESGDEVGIIVSGSSTYTNARYVTSTSGSSVSFSAYSDDDVIYFTEANQTYTFYSYYPYASSLESNGTIAVNTLESQEDVLWATASATYTGSGIPTVSFAYSHCLAQYNLAITSATSLTDKTIKIGGLKHAGYFNPADGTIDASASSAEDWTLTSPTEEYSYSFSGYVIPQSSANMTLTVGENSVDLPTLNKNKLEAGKSYTVAVTISEDGEIKVSLVTSGNTIDSWGSGETAKIAFVGPYESGSLSNEAGAAYAWLSANVDGAEYVSLSEIINETVTLSDYDAVWMHFDWKTGGDNGTTNETYDGYVTSATSAIASYYSNGGKIFASRDALCYVGNWGITSDSNGANNIWGGDGTGTLSDSQGIYIVDSSHEIFSGLSLSGNILYLRFAGLPTTDRVVQWYCGSDWGNYTGGLSAWTSATGGTQLGADGNNTTTTVRMAEFKTGGTAIVIGDPSFEWYNNSVSNSYESNLTGLTKNILDYLVAIE